MTLKLLVPSDPELGGSSSVEDVRHLGLRRVQLTPRLGLDDDLVDVPVASERVLHRGQRRDRGVVLVGGPVRSLGRGHADDLEVRAVDLDRLADRIRAAEQLADDGRADHEHAVVVLLVAAREPRALGHRVAARSLVRRRGADERRRLIGRRARRQRHPVGARHRRGALDVGRLERVRERVRVGHGEAGARAGARLPPEQAPERGGAAHQQHVGAERVDLVLDRRRRPRADRDQHDHRADADHQTEDRQSRPQLVGGRPPSATRRISIIPPPPHARRARRR